ncbi:MAG: adenosine kinase [Saprospiraceae bacterium]|jgi:adenosine kinase
MKISVLGPIPRDHITTHKGEVVEKYGCITHPAIALAILSGADAEIIPVAHVHRIDEAHIKEVFRPYSNINLDHITSDADQGDVISLKFLDQNHREEKQLAFMNPILPEDVEKLMDSDVFVFLPITDFEIALDTLKYIKANSDGIIIFDAHGPTNTVTKSGDRYNKFWIDQDQWLPYIDVLKMNLEEANCCLFKKEYSLEELQNAHHEDESQLKDLGKYCLDRGVKAVIITLDERGCMIYSKKDGEILEEFVPSVRVENVVDTTGCGDSFAGGIAFGLMLEEGNYVLAAKYGNALGAQRTQGKTFDVFLSLEETNKMIADTYNRK